MTWFICAKKYIQSPTLAFITLEGPKYLIESTAQYHSTLLYNGHLSTWVALSVPTETRDGRIQIKLAMYTVHTVYKYSRLDFVHVEFGIQRVVWISMLCCFRSHSSRRRVERCLNYRDEWRSQSQFSNIKFYSPFRLSAPTGINTNFACNSVKTAYTF